MEKKGFLAVLYLGFLIGFIIGCLFVDWAYNYHLTK